MKTQRNGNEKKLTEGNKNPQFHHREAIRTTCLNLHPVETNVIEQRSAESPFHNTYD